MKRFLIAALLVTTSVSSAHAQASLDSLWNKLAYTDGGCLVGRQYDLKDRYAEGCVLVEHPDWQLFFKFPKADVSDFLLQKLSDTATTEVHTCPFFSATTGELAVYCLQRVHQKCWYDIPGFQEYATRQGTGSKDCHQVWLQAILADEKQRNQLADYYRRTGK